MTLLAAVVIFASSLGIALVIPRWWVAFDPPLLAAAWWVFSYATDRFADRSADRHGILMAVLGASVGEAGVVAGLVAARVPRLAVRLKHSRHDRRVAARDRSTS